MLDPYCGVKRFIEWGQTNSIQRKVLCGRRIEEEVKGMRASVLSSLSLSLLTFTLAQAERQTSICSLEFRREFLNGYILLDWKIHDFVISTDLG